MFRSTQYFKFLTQSTYLPKHFFKAANTCRYWTRKAA